MVTFTTAFHLRRVGNQLLVTGSGRLLPTFKSPIAASFTITGTATFAPKLSHPSSQGGQGGLLTLVFAVR